MRAALSLLIAAVGLALMVVSYLFLAAPIGAPIDSPIFSNPRVPFSPLLFILGVMLVFLSAVVYELLPEKRD